MQEGCDADIVVFGPDKVTDNEIYKPGEGVLPTTGIPYVLVNGGVVVKDSEVLPVFPGKPFAFLWSQKVALMATGLLLVGMSACGSHPASTKPKRR